MPFPLLLYRLLKFGRRSELLGIDYLRSLGYRVVTSSYRTKDGEVDIIGWDGDILAFIEVKARQSSEPPQDSVGHRKQRRVIRAAQDYLSRHHLQDASYRFDILAVTANPGCKPEFRLFRDAYRMYN
ncbi:MAG: YraN family protein [Acidobacteria bacterium]|nr:MAG: YraN family protein [Acidobacteriota bacterium]